MRSVICAFMWIGSGRCWSRWVWRPALIARGRAVLEAESTMISSLSVPVTDAAVARSILRIMDELEEHDDVQDVYANFDISEEVMEAVAS